MRQLARISILAAALVAALPAAAGAAPIVVGEFRWDVTEIDFTGDPTIPPLFQSIYSLTGLWDGTDPAPTLTGTVNVADGTTFDWFPVDGLGGFDQVGFFLDTFPTLAATTTVFFDFGGETRTLVAALTAPGGFTLTFDPDQGGTDPGPAPVPEPGTLALVGLGLAAIARKRRRASKGLAGIA